MIHVCPIADTRSHEIEGTMCWCQPDVDFSGAEAIVTHHAADGREAVEAAERILRNAERN